MKANNGTPQSAKEMKPATLPCGPNRGFGKLVSKPGIYRCRLRPETNKARPEFADYRGIMQLSGGAKAFVLLWVHQDGSLGLRLEMMKLNPPEKGKAA